MRQQDHSWMICWWDVSQVDVPLACNEGNCEEDLEHLENERLCLRTQLIVLAAVKLPTHNTNIKGRRWLGRTDYRADRPQ